MPLGNGDLGAGVYAIKDGDLFLLLSKSDALNYNGDLFKTGRVRVSLQPNPFVNGRPFRQTLDLSTGSILIAAGDTSLRIWADANHPVYHVQIQSAQDLQVTVSSDPWPRFDTCAYNVNDYLYRRSGPKAGQVPTQDVQLERDGKLLWYYGVGDRSVFADDLDFYGVSEMAAQIPDPYRFNTFGNLVEADGLRPVGGKLVGSGHKFDVRIYSLTRQAPSAQTWIESIQQLAAQPHDWQKDWTEHCSWWGKFWNRSWIRTSDHTVPKVDREKLQGEASPNGQREEPDGAALVAQSYNVFRFLMACQGQGRLPAKFNGGLFSQQMFTATDDPYRRSGGKTKVEGGWLTHEDDRLWGRRFTYQNERLLYWPLLCSGDYELMKPFFAYYFDRLPMRRAITQVQFGHAGVYFRENLEPTGGERDCGIDGRPGRNVPGRTARYYHDYYYTNGLETTAMLLDYVAATESPQVRDQLLVPFAREVLLFFQEHYARGADGKLRIDPGQVLETWWRAINPAPDIAGLRFCLDGLIAQNVGTVEDQRRWREFRATIPEIPMREIAGRLAIAPAESWSEQHNSENGELYPVFPFRCYGFALGTSTIADWTIRHRTCVNVMNFTCWNQDQIHWALAGQAQEAAQGLVRRFRSATAECRFPLYGSNVGDGCPDFDHFGAGAIAVQRMLVQEAGDKIFLLPAWPAQWDADFKLRLSHQTILTGTVKDGRLTSWDIQPSTRRKNVVVVAPQPVAPAGDAVNSSMSSERKN